MEYLVCPSVDIGDVILDGNNQGPNQDKTGQLLVKKCNEGLHSIALKNCLSGNSYLEKQVHISDTDPIAPAQVPFP